MGAILVPRSRPLALWSGVDPCLLHYFLDSRLKVVEAYQIAPWSQSSGGNIGRSPSPSSVGSLLLECRGEVVGAHQVAPWEQPRRGGGLDSCRVAPWVVEEGDVARPLWRSHSSVGSLLLEVVSARCIFRMLCDPGSVD